MNLRVVSPGFQTHVQDLGRFGYTGLGISASGAADTISLRAGNLLVGNPENAPALEMTLVGGAFEFDGDAVVAITGSDFGASVPAWRAVNCRAGETLRLGAARSGARCYLCIQGGIDVPQVLGSASTHLSSGIGGFEGRALRKGDVLRIGMNSGPVQRKVPKLLPDTLSRKALRVTPGLQAGWFPDAALCGPTWRVTEESSRMGLRLSGPRILPHTPQELLTEGVSVGAIQVPSGGQPIILFVEHQTTGGYPKIANVISADLPVVGQLRPRDEVRFEPVGFDEARRLLLEQEEAILALA
ncbi:MAG: biotin-dependent carboxyltransferase family protein [Bryobacteraceae bacterium]